MPEKQEQKLNNEQPIRQNQEAEAPAKPHNIDTYYAGGLVPGQEQMVADSIDGKPVNVQFLHPGEVVADIIDDAENRENTVLSQVNKDNIIEKQAAMAATENETREETKDIVDLSNIFDANLYRLLAVDPSSIENPSIPKQGKHFLITKADLPQILAELKRLSYDTEEITGIGITAKKESSQFTFIFAEEPKQVKKQSVK